MKPRVYVETSVVSYLTARPARDIVIARAAAEHARLVGGREGVVRVGDFGAGSGRSGGGRSRCRAIAAGGDLAASRSAAPVHAGATCRSGGRRWNLIRLWPRCVPCATGSRRVSTMTSTPLSGTSEVWKPHRAAPTCSLRRAVVRVLLDACVWGGATAVLFCASRVTTSSGSATGPGIRHAADQLPYVIRSGDTPTGACCPSCRPGVGVPR